MFSFFTAFGSRSSDFRTDEDVESPLPPCPDSPNCVRITKPYPADRDSLWETSIAAMQQMKPYEMELTPDEYRIDAVFAVVFFRDDLVLQLQAKDSTSSYLHLRSASRVGHSDLGVNRRRVHKFLVLMDEKIQQPNSE